MAIGGSRGSVYTSFRCHTGIVRCGRFSTWTSPNIRCPSWRACICRASRRQFSCRDPPRRANRRRCCERLGSRCAGQGEGQPHGCPPIPSMTFSAALAAALSPATRRAVGRTVAWDLGIRVSRLLRPNIRAALRQKFPQDGSVAAALVPAVAAQRQVCLVRQRRQYVQFPAPIRLAHLLSELPREYIPRSLVLRCQCILHERCAGR